MGIVYCANEDVMQADHNAAQNILARLYDKEIMRYMRAKEVKQILLLRSSDGTDRQVAWVASHYYVVGAE